MGKNDTLLTTLRGIKKLTTIRGTFYVDTREQDTKGTLTVLSPEESPDGVLRLKPIMRIPDQSRNDVLKTIRAYGTLVAAKKHADRFKAEVLDENALHDVMYVKEDKRVVSPDETPVGWAASQPVKEEKVRKAVVITSIKKKPAKSNKFR